MGVRRDGSRRHAHDSEQGAAAVEMALILPLLLTLVFGIIEFGFVFNAQISLTQAVREGVRVGAIGDDMTEANMLGRMEDSYLGIGGGTLSGSGTPCASGDTDGQARLTGRLAYTTPIGRFGPFTLEAEAVMRCGG
jgi:hypothetical protein